MILYYLLVVAVVGVDDLVLVVPRGKQGHAQRSPRFPLLTAMASN